MPNPALMEFGSVCRRSQLEPSSLCRCMLRMCIPARPHVRGEDRIPAIAFGPRSTSVVFNAGLGDSAERKGAVTTFTTQQHHRPKGSKHPRAEGLSTNCGSRHEIAQSLRIDSSRISSSEEPPRKMGLRQLAAEREEVKAVLLQFLKSIGLSTTLSSRVIKKGGNFVDHLLTILHTRYHRSYAIGKEPTTAEIQGTLLSYLAALAAEQGEDLVNFLVYFPDPPPAKIFSFGKSTPLPSSSKFCQSRSHTGISRLTLDGNYRPSVSFALSLGLSLDQVKDLARKAPGFITCNPERNIKPVVSYFLGLGVPKPGIMKILMKRPQVFVCSLEEYLKPSMRYLESVGVNKNQWPRILVKFPALITYGRAKVEAAVDFLQTAGISSADVGVMITRYPHIVSFSVEENLAPTLEFFKSIGVNDGAQFLRKAPQVLGYSVEGNIKPTLRFLIELGYSQIEVTTMINKFPQILGLAINSNIKPKWDYYCETGWPKSHLVSFPHYFGYSLETRIKPRFNEALRQGLCLSPNRILSLSDSDFERLLEEQEGNASIHTV